MKNDSTQRPFLERILQVRPDEWPVLLRLWGCYFMLSCGLEVAKLAAETLFLSRAGVRWLPTLFGLQALANAGAAGVYALLASRWNSRQVFTGLIVGFGIAMCITAAGVAIVPGLWAYGILYGCAEVGATLLKIHWGVFILELYQPGSAARLFPFLYTAAALGRSGGGVLIRQGAAAVGLEWLTCMSLAGCIALAVVALQAAARKARAGRQRASSGPKGASKASGTEKGPPDAWPDLQTATQASLEESFSKPTESEAEPTVAPKRPVDPTEGLPPQEAAVDKSPETELPDWISEDLYRRGWTGRLKKALRHCLRSNLLRAIATATGLMVLVRFCTRYAYLVVFKSHLDEQALAQLLGTYSIVANLAGLVLQLFLVPRILRRFGIQTANLAYAVALTAGLGLLAASGHIWAGLGARFVDLEFKAAFKTPVSPIFYFGVPPKNRAEARAFILGAVVPAATILGGLILQLARQWLPFASIGFAGLAIGAGYVLATHWQNRTYFRARQALDGPSEAKPRP